MLALDFDGLFTDVEVEGVPFTEGYLADLATLTGLSLKEVREEHGKMRDVVMADPSSYPWMMDGLAVAPTTVDPYLRIKPIAEMILSRAGCQIDRPTLQRLLTSLLYKKNYLLSATCFRPGAKELLLALFLAQDDAFIITNSYTDAVVDKLRSMAMDMAEENGPETGGAFLKWWQPRVFGDAKKYIASMDEEPGSPLDLSIPGLDRKVLCVRPHYQLVLEQLMSNLGISWDQLTVAGDIFELDLALPLGRGARVGLLRNSMTPAYELDFLRGHPNAVVMDFVDQILPFYRAGRSAT